MLFMFDSLQDNESSISSSNNEGREKANFERRLVRNEGSSIKPVSSIISYSGGQWNLSDIDDASRL